MIARREGFLIKAGATVRSFTVCSDQQMGYHIPPNQHPLPEYCFYLQRLSCIFFLYLFIVLHTYYLHASSPSSLGTYEGDYGTLKSFFEQLGESPAILYWIYWFHGYFGYNFQGAHTVEDFWNRITLICRISYSRQNGICAVCGFEMGESESVLIYPGVTTALNRTSSFISRVRKTSVLCNLG